MELELDTGALLTLINRTLFNEFTQESPLTLQHSTAQLRTYTGESVNMAWQLFKPNMVSNYCNYQFM